MKAEANIDLLLDCLGHIALRYDRNIDSEALLSGLPVRMIRIWNLRVVILKGAGRSFSAGADISGEMAEPISFHLDSDYKPFLTGIEKSDKLWIAQVHGAAAGIGAALAMNCDLVVMAEDAYIYMAFAAIGLIPDGGNTQLLLQYLGYHRALQAVLEGRKLDAQECLASGIANKVVSGDELEPVTMAWA